MSRNAWVTGAAGFIGRHACRELARRGWRVAGIGHGDWPAAEWQAWGLDAWLPADITVPALEELARRAGEPDLLIHCAGGASVPFSQTHPQEDCAQTVTTTARMLDFARRIKPLAIVYPSSGAVYGEAAACPIPETAPLRPVSPYGVHKCQAEDLCRKAAADGMRVAMVRLFSVYGPGLRKQLLWDACLKARTGDFRFSGTGAEIRDWLHVSDAVALLLLAAARAAPDCPVVNGGTGIGTSVREITGIVGREWRPAAVPGFTGEPRPGDPDDYVAETARLRTWGFRPQVEVAAGVREYVDWFGKESEP